MHEDAARKLPYDTQLSNWQYYGQYSPLSSAGWNICEDIKFSPLTGGQGGSARSAP